MLDWCTQKVYYIVHKFMSVTLSVITGGIYTIISESKFTQPRCKKKLDKLEKKGYNISNISRYATKKNAVGEFDEMLTEYRVLQLLGKDK